MRAAAVDRQSVLQTSPNFIARMVGVCYLVLLASGFDMFYVFGKVVVGSDAAATAANVRAHEGMFVAGFAVALLGVASYLVVTALLYRLFEPVNRTLSLTAAFFGLTGCLIQAVALIFHLVPLLFLDNQSYLSAFQPRQLQALALLSLNSYGKAYNISLVFFGFYLLQIGYLTFRSTFLPRWLGVLVMFGGGWLAFLCPPLARALYPYVMLSSVGELLLVLWLLVKGVDEQRWHEQAAAVGLPR
jgi:Domain of unknown function (DUF4386)